ncbi:hypothetical protein LPJ66_002772 [Kickxella alabastrina]|uniref:Uncharacterized protein n=1 Tax=Kickxella alabastrina TaxID=61397 RepID=A0ACC1IPJ0_9FUNG|nr:hypothetical protein LPJ66_002772 [Kickxella alabastrina]
MMTSTNNVTKRAGKSKKPSTTGEHSKREDKKHNDYAPASCKLSKSIIITIAITLMISSRTAGALLTLGPQYLEPLYGNVLAQLGFLRALLVVMAAGGALGVLYWRRILARKQGGSPSVDAQARRAITRPIDLAAIMMALAPVPTDYLLRFSGRLGPMWGPMVTQCALSFPALVLCGFASAIAIARASHGASTSAGKAAVVVALLGVCGWVIMDSALSAHFRYGGHSLLITAVLLSFANFVSKFQAGSEEFMKALPKPAEERAPGGAKSARPAQACLGSRPLKMAMIVPTMVVILLASIMLVTNRHCKINGGVISTTPEYRMLLRKESTTGWITVSDEHDRGMRVLRSGHSLIGGQWSTTRESIFAIFYYADAVRMIRGAQRENEHALIIGLGAGISARSLHKRKVRVDVVEIDPVVYHAAVGFFGLPRDLNAVHLCDARAFIESAPFGTYDYIVHDVFTGGSVPPSLFSQEAVAHLHRILLPDGVLAMNYVGIPNDHRSMAHITATLRTTFEYVRCFIEPNPARKDDPEKDTSGVLSNMMFFASDAPLNFQIPAVDSSPGRNTSLRKAVLSEMLANEIILPNDAVRPLTDAWNPLSEWQLPGAIQHWHAMRSIFPEEYWLDY